MLWIRYLFHNCALRFWIVSSAWLTVAAGPGCDPKATSSKPLSSHEDDVTSQASPDWDLLHERLRIVGLQLSKEHRSASLDNMFADGLNTYARLTVRGDSGTALALFHPAFIEEASQNRMVVNSSLPWWDVATEDATSRFYTQTLMNGKAGAYVLLRRVGTSTRAYIFVFRT